MSHIQPLRYFSLNTILAEYSKSSLFNIRIVFVSFFLVLSFNVCKKVYLIKDKN